MTLFKSVLRPHILRTNTIYNVKKNKQKYTQQQICKRQLYTSPPIPPNTPIVLMLGLVTSYYILSKYF